MCSVSFGLRQEVWQEIFPTEGVCPILMKRSLPQHEGRLASRSPLPPPHPFPKDSCNGSRGHVCILFLFDLIVPSPKETQGIGDL